MSPIAIILLMTNQILFQALAELAYSISLADGEMQPEEKEVFINLIEQEFKNDSWWAINRFKLLETQERKNIEQCYQFAIFAIRTNRSDFSEDLRNKFLNIITKVAESSDGLDANEKKLIERFKNDVVNI